MYIIQTNQSGRIIGENACYTRLESKKAYPNTPMIYSKWLPKWAKEQDFWAKLEFREWMITIVKRNISDTNISPIKSCWVACYSGKKLLKSYDTVLKYLFSKNVKNRYFVAIFVNIFFLFFANSREIFICFNNSSGQTFNKKSRLCFLVCFGNKLKDFLNNRRILAS